MTIYCSPVQVYQTGLLKAFPWLVSIPGYLKSQFQDGDLLVSRGSGKSGKEIVSAVKLLNVYTGIVTELMTSLDSLAPRPPVFDHLHGGRRPGESYHVIRGMADVTDSRCDRLFATEELKN